jgi:hypothetical protein
LNKNRPKYLGRFLNFDLIIQLPVFQPRLAETEHQPAAEPHSEELRPELCPSELKQLQEQLS